jgi:hypothetical protein
MTATGTDNQANRSTRRHGPNPSVASQTSKKTTHPAYRGKQRKKKPQEVFVMKGNETANNSQEITANAGAIRIGRGLGTSCSISSLAIEIKVAQPSVSARLLSQ